MDNVKNKEDRKNKKEIFRCVCAIISLVVGIAGLVSTCENLNQSRYHTPTISIQEKSPSVDDLKNKRADKTIYPCFDDKVINNEKYKGYCATQLQISNRNDESVLLDKMILEATDIEPIEEPIFTVDLVTENDEVMFVVDNHGWGDTEGKVTFSFKDISNNSKSASFLSKRNSIVIDSIKAGERKRKQLWSNTDLLDTGSDGTFQLEVTCKDHNGNMLGKKVIASIEISDGKFIGGGKGEASQQMYGVEIKTSKQDYTWEVGISESINANDHITLPICFASDKSCKFKFSAKLETVGRNSIKNIISTLPAEIELIISSRMNDMLNADDFTLDELRSRMELENQINVSYPYVGLEDMEKVASKARRKR